MEKTRLLTFTVLTALLLTSLTAFSMFAVTVPTFTLSLSSNQLQYVLPVRTTFNGSVSTTGMVRFWVSAPNEAEIINLGIIDKTTTFSFIAQQDGTYTFNFENDLPNTIQVTFSYVTDPAIPSNNSTGISTTYMLITVIIAVTGSVLIILVLRHKSKTQTPVVNKRQSQT